MKDKLIASFRNPKPYPLPPQNLIKQGTRKLSHLTEETNIDISRIRVETEPSTFCKNFTNIKRVGLQLSQSNINSEGRKTLHIHFVTKLLNDMKDSTPATLTDGSSLINARPTGAGVVIFGANINESPVKLAKAFSSNSTSYHGEIDAILLVITHIFSTKSKVNANAIHIFSDSIATISAITSLSPQEIHHDRMEEIIQST